MASDPLKKLRRRPPPPPPWVEFLTGHERTRLDRLQTSLLGYEPSPDTAAEIGRLQTIAEVRMKMMKGGQT